MASFYFLFFISGHKTDLPSHK